MSSPALTPIAEPAPSPPPLDILFLDDSEATRRAMELTLGRLGHRVICAASVREAIAALRTFVFDLVICDISLPDGTGWDVVGHVPAAPRVHRIALSGHGERADVERSLAAGFDVHLVKPVDLALLQRTVWQLTGKTL